MGGWVIIWPFLYGSSPLSNLEWKYLGYGLEKKEEKEKFPPLLSLACMQCAMRNGFREREYTKVGLRCILYRYRCGREGAQDSFAESAKSAIKEKKR